MRRYLLTLSGLAFCVSPLFAQEYIDLEAERQQVDQPASQGAAAATSSTTTYLPAPAAAQPGPGTVSVGGGSNAGELYYQLQVLQQEVMELRGQVEQQAHELRQLKQQSLERYVDIDRRLSATPEPGVGESATDTNGAAASKPVQELAGEADAYRAAYSMVRSQKFKDAVGAFRAFLQDFPDGKYAANAHYWLGELFLVIAPPDLESSRREFILLIEQYPDNAKVPDALYKLGKVYFEKGNRDKSREYLDRVIGQYGDGNSSAVKLARDFLSQNF